MAINNPARLLTNYKKQREFQSRIDLGVKTLNDLKKDTKYLKNNHLQTLLKYSVDALTCLRSKEDVYIKASEFAIDTMKKTPLGKLIHKFLEQGFEMWINALKAARDTFPLQEAFSGAYDVCEKIVPLYQKALLDHKFQAARMGQGVISHMLLNQDAYSGLSREEIKEISSELLQNGKALVSALEFLIVAGIETIQILPELEKELEAMENKTEHGDAFQQIFGRTIKESRITLQRVTAERNPDSNLQAMIRLRDTWATWADVMPMQTDTAYYLQKARASE